MRVTLEDSKPKVGAILTDMLLTPQPHIFAKKAAWGADGEIRQFTTGYHDVVDWDALSNVKEQKTGEPGRWIDLSRELYAPSESINRWHSSTRRYNAYILYLGFFSRENDQRKDRRPIFKQNEAGNLDWVRVRIEFASRPEAGAVFRTISESCMGSGIALYLDPEMKEREQAFASVCEVIDRRIAELKRNGAAEQPLPKRILISRRECPGHFYPLFSREAILKMNELYRLLGIRSIQYNSVEKPSDFYTYVWTSSDPGFVEGTRPEWVSKEPSDPKLEEKSAVAARRLPKVEGKPLLVKFGDETSVLPKSFFQDQRVRDRFAAFLKDRKIAPETLGAASYGQVGIMDDPKAATTPEKRRLYYYSCIFRSEIVLDWYKRMVDAMRGAYPGKLIATGEICWEDSRDFPEISRAFELGVFDVASHECATMLWVMPHGAIYRLAAQRSASREGKTQPGILYGSYRGGDGLYDIIELDGTSALLHGMEHIYWYSDTSFSPGGFTAPEYHAGMMKINQRAARLENWILDGESPLRSPQAALVKSYAGEIWGGNTRFPYFQEFEMAAAALAWNQLPFDILSDEATVRNRERYRVIYLASPVLPLVSREPLKAWCEAGGRLVLLGSSAATRSEFNEEASFAGFLGLPPAKKEGMEVHPLGKGMVFRFAGTPGQNLRNSFEPADKALPIKHVFHRFSDGLVAQYAAPFDAAPALERPILCSRKGVEVNFFEAKDHKSCAVIAADYTSKETKELTLKMRLKGHYRTATDENGKKYPVRNEGPWSVLEKVPVGISAVLILE